MGVFGAPTVHAVTPGADLARRHWDQVLNGSWLGLLSDGELALPGRGVRRSDDWVGAFDLIGLRADPPVGVTDEGRLTAWPVGARIDGSGFAPEPDELSLVLERVHETLGDPTLVVAAHGVTTTDDDWRDELIRRTLAVIEGARHDGIDVRGYVHDTGIDGYDWHRGFAAPRGLIDRDRRPRPSLARIVA
jgi:hypothetical protein